MTRNGAVRVSIVTPFLNADRFIREAVDSVLAQTYPDWELLLVDDGSSDGSTAIARAFATAHPRRIRYLTHDGRINKGASASRNLGTSVARGEYVAFLDADDVYLPRKLEEQVPLLDAHPQAGMLYGGTEYWYGWTGRPEDRARDRVWRRYGVAPNAIIEPPRMLTTFLRNGATVPCMGSVLARRGAIERVGGWEESFRHVCTDQVFHAKLSLHFPVFVADGCWDRYRQHDESSCHVAKRAGQSDAAFERYLLWLEGYLVQQRVRDPEVWAAFRQALREHRHPWMYRLERQAAQQVARVRRALTGGR
jgi:glycosyltransferase involved in cell wall biosynthesis